MFYPPPLIGVYWVPPTYNMVFGYPHLVVRPEDNESFMMAQWGVKLNHEKAKLNFSLLQRVIPNHVQKHPQEGKSENYEYLQICYM